MRIIQGCAVLAVTLMVGCSDDPRPPESQSFPPNSGFAGFGGDAVGFGSGGSSVFGAAGGAVFGGGSYDQPLVVASDPPPPVSGGTLLIFGQGHKAAVSDPDHDHVVLVDLDKASVISSVALQKGDEPGRLVEDGAGAIHVVLRRAGAIATIDPVGGTLSRRDAVCGIPRGIAYDKTADVLHVACAGGELVTLSPSDATVTRTVTLPRDLRDVVVDGDHLVVSRFRSAELLVLDAQGSVSSTIKPPDLFTFGMRSTPAVAWRTVAAPGGGVLMVHEQEQVDEVQIQQPGGYGGNGCGSIVRSAVSLIMSDGTGGTLPISAPLAIDLAVTNESSPRVALPAAGLRSSVIVTSQSPQVVFAPLPAMAPPAGSSFDAGFATCDLQSGNTMSNAPGQVVALAIDATGRTIVQTREPYAVVIAGKSVTLPGDSRKDTGHDLFHLATAAGLACASCHPEGREDGHVWTFTGLGQRRTQSISGGILGTEPFHWNGDMADFLTLTHHVFNERMSGPVVGDDYVAALSKWIDKIPLLKPSAPADAAAVDRGKALFTSKDVGCADCHSGTKMTNNTTVDVGTGDKFQVPSLRGVVWRAPFMHNGCAATLADRFGSCGGTNHGHPPAGDAAKADLIAYLESL
jgi:hypothetical protein